MRVPSYRHDLSMATIVSIEELSTEFLVQLTASVLKKEDTCQKKKPLPHPSPQSAPPVAQDFYLVFHLP